jgi:hypothetical protein
MKKLCTDCVYLKGRECLRPSRLTGLPLLSAFAEIERSYLRLFGCWFIGRFFKKKGESWSRCHEKM